MNRLLALLFVIMFPQAHADSVGLLEQKLNSNPNDIVSRVKLAEVHLNNNEFQKTVDLLNAYTDQLPKSGFRVLAFAYSNLKKFDDEVRVLNIITARDEENHEWHMLLGQAYLKQAASLKNVNDEGSARNLTLGIQQLRKTLKLQPKFKPAFDLLLKTFIEQKSNNEARELLLEGVRVFGERPELFRELCRIDSNDGFLVQAVTNCKKSIELSPRYPDHYVFLVQALYDQKEELKAEKQVVAAAKKFPRSEYVQWAAGTLFLRKKNFPVAARYFQVAATLDPKSGRAQFGLAQALFESGRETEALEPFIKACKADRFTVDTFLAAGGRLKQAGKAELGSKYVQAASNCRL